MVKATVCELNGGWFAELSGHADAGAKGSDVVCAGISSLVCAVIDRLDTMASEGQLYYRGRYLYDGYACVEFTPAENAFAADRCATLMNLLRAGLDRIEEKYPENISVEQ